MKILVVDDDCDMQDMWIDMFTALGHEVVVAKDGMEGLAIYMRGEFDFVMSDYQMPRVHGVRLLMEIRAMSPTQKMALASGDPPRMPKEIADIPVLLKGTFTSEDIKALLAK